MGARLQQRLIHFIKRITLEFNHAMKHTFLILLIVTGIAASSAQTPTNPAATSAPAANPPASAPAASTQTPASQPATAAPATKPAAAAATTTPPPDYENAPSKVADIHCNRNNTCEIKLPPGIPPQEGTVKKAFTLYYQDIKIGTGALAGAHKEYVVHYTGWLAFDGSMFDTSYEHRGVVMDKNGKPVKDANGKDKLGDPQPFTFTQGAAGIDRVLTGLDEGFVGMRVGGKRRLIIPYQLAYGEKARPSPDADHPVGIPPKSDLIMDVELLQVNDAPKKKH